MAYTLGVIVVIAVVVGLVYKTYSDWTEDPDQEIRKPDLPRKKISPRGKKEFIDPEKLKKTAILPHRIGGLGYPTPDSDKPYPIPEPKGKQKLHFIDPNEGRYQDDIWETRKSETVKRFEERMKGTSTCNNRGKQEVDTERVGGGNKSGQERVGVSPGGKVADGSSVLMDSASGSASEVYKPEVIELQELLIKYCQEGIAAPCTGLIEPPGFAADFLSSAEVISNNASWMLRSVIGLLQSLYCSKSCSRYWWVNEGLVCECDGLRKYFSGETANEQRLYPF